MVFRTENFLDRNWFYRRDAPAPVPQLFEAKSHTGYFLQLQIDSTTGVRDLACNIEHLSPEALGIPCDFDNRRIHIVFKGFEQKK